MPEIVQEYRPMKTNTFFSHKSRQQAFDCLGTVHVDQTHTFGHSTIKQFHGMTPQVNSQKTHHKNDTCFKEANLNPVKNYVKKHKIFTLERIICKPWVPNHSIEFRTLLMADNVSLV